MTSVAEPASASRSPAVSVLLPVYNGGPFIGGALDSVLAQTFTDFEVIVIDDGSTDETADRLQERAHDHRLRVTRHRQNQGLVASLNEGLTLCSGTLVARLDADDACLPTRLEAQVAAFREDPDLVLCATDYERVAPSGVVTHLGQPPPTHAALAVALLTGNRLRHSSAMFRRDAALEAGGYDVGWFPVEDYDLWLRLLELGVYRSVPAVTVRCLENAQGISSTHIDEQAAASRARAEISIRRWTGGELGGDAPTVLPGHDGGAGTPRVEVRALADAVGGITRDLKRRGIRTCGAYSQALAIAMGLYVGQPRLTRHWAILRSSPALYTRGQIERRRWRRR